MSNLENMPKHIEKADNDNPINKLQKKKYELEQPMKNQTGKTFFPEKPKKNRTNAKPSVPRGCSRPRRCGGVPVGGAGRLGLS